MQHDADDILADIVHVAFDRSQHDAALRLLGQAQLLALLLHEGRQMGDGLFHHARRFHDLRQEHLARAEQVADDVHAVHQRAFDDVQRAFGVLARFLCVLDDIFIDAADQRVLQPLFDRPFAPFQILLVVLLPAAGVAIFLRRFQQVFGRVLMAVEDHVFAKLPQLGIDIVIDVELAGIDDAHIHARLDGVLEEDRVHGPAHGFVAAEGEGDIGNAARNMGVRAGFLDLLGRLNEGVGVVVMLLDPGGDREDVRVENNVFGREADLLGQDLVGPLADLDLAFLRVGLTFLVKRHDHDRRAVAQAFPGLLDEAFLALLHGDGVHDGLALNAFQAGLDHCPFGRVDHDRNTGNVRF